MQVIVPTLQEVFELTLAPGRLTDYGRWLLDNDPMAGGASDTDYTELKLLEHKWGKTSWTMPATVALALTTVVPTDASTGASITEAGYTGYARKVIAGSDLSTASAGEIHNVNVLTFAACTASSSTVIGWAICDSSSTGAGNAISWGTVTSTVISTTQTPATVAASALSGTQD